jgi:hypothetical protein
MEAPFVSAQIVGVGDIVNQRCHAEPGSDFKTIVFRDQVFAELEPQRVL